MADPKVEQQVRGLCNAVQVLCTHPDETARKQADAYIIKFQDTLEAWRVCDHLLQVLSLPSEAYFFAGKILHTKVTFSFHELTDGKSRAGFRDALLSHTVRFNNGPATVRTQLCLAVAALVVQMADDWPNAPQELTEKLAKPETAMSLLEILTYLPDESCNEHLRVAEEKRQKIMHALNVFSPTVLKVLITYLQAAQNRELQGKVFACFYSWIRYCQIPPEELIRSPLVNASFDALGSPELFDVGVDCICQLIRRSESLQNYGAALAQVLFTRTLQLRPAFEQAVARDDYEPMKAFARIFVELGESYLDVILSGQPQYMMLVDAILKCVALPHQSISSMSFHFWYTLAKRIDNTEDASARDMRRSQFQQVYRSLCDLLRGVIKYPAEVDRWDEDKKDEHKRYRHFAADTILDCAIVLGNIPCLQIIFESLKGEFEQYAKQPQNWYGLEAALYCVRSIARKVPLTENAIVSQVMTMLPHLTTNKHLKYSDWINLHPNYLPKTLAFVVASLSATEDAMVVSAASFSFKHLCDGCSSHLTNPSYLPELFKVYNGSPALGLQDQNDIIEGICFVVSALPSDQIHQGLGKLLLPVAQELQMLLTAHAQLAPAGKEPDDNRKKMDERMAACLDRLSHILMKIDPRLDREESPAASKSSASTAATAPFLRNTVSSVNIPIADGLNGGPNGLASAEDRRKEEEEKERTRKAIVAATIDMLQKLWPLLDHVLTTYKSDGRMMEKLCRCWKCAIKTTQVAFAPFLVPLVMHLSSLFPQLPHSCFLYVASICVDVFGPVEASHPTLANIFSIFTKQTLAILTGPSSFTMHPDIAEDFFDLMKRFIRRCPELVLNASNTLLPAVIHCGVSGIGVEHREACSALMHFFDEFLSVAIPSETYKPNPQIQTVVANLLVVYGQGLVTGLMNCVAGAVPHSRIRFVVFVIDALLRFNHPSTRTWFTEAVKRLPDTRDPDKGTFLHRLFAAKDATAIRATVLDFERASRLVRRYG